MKKWKSAGVTGILEYFFNLFYLRKKSVFIINIYYSVVLIYKFGHINEFLFPEQYILF